MRYLGIIPFSLVVATGAGFGYPSSCMLKSKLHTHGGFPGGTVGKESTCQCRRHMRHGFDSWVRKISWRREWQPIPVFLPGEVRGQRSLAGPSPWGHRVRHSWTHALEHTHIYTHWLLLLLLRSHFSCVPTLCDPIDGSPHWLVTCYYSLCFISFTTCLDKSD